MKMQYIDTKVSQDEQPEVVAELMKESARYKKGRIAIRHKIGYDMDDFSRGLITIRAYQVKAPRILNYKNPTE